MKEVGRGSDEQIREMLTNGTGPAIVSYPDLRQNKKGEVVEISHASYDPSTNTMNISPEIVGVLEFELNPGGDTNPLSGLGGIAPDNADKQVAFKILGVQIGHEGVHKLRDQNGQPKKAILKDGQEKEAGDLFEEKVFGKNQGRLRAQDLRKTGENERTEADSEKFNYNANEDSNSEIQQK